MANFDWDGFLALWSQILLSDEDLLAEIPPEAIDIQRSRIGYPGAGQNQIEEAEARLGVSLPATYRSFLQSSNGWPLAGLLVEHLLPVGEVDWFVKRNREWLEAWRYGFHYYGDPPPVQDADYSVYGEAQNPLLIREEYLEACLQIGEGDNAVYLLNPRVTFEDGEWEAWFFESEMGAQRYRSFWDLMQSEYQTFRSRP